MIELSD